MAQKPANFVAYFDLVDACKEEGCPVCFQEGHRSMDRMWVAMVMGIRRHP